MKFNECDIVFIHPCKKEGMITNYCLDLETLKYKYTVIVENENNDECEMYICLEEQLTFITTFEDRLEQVKVAQREDAKA